MIKLEKRSLFSDAIPNRCGAVSVIGNLRGRYMRRKGYNMKTVIRKGVFETNSSSTHSLAIVRGDERAPKGMEVCFRVCSPVAKVFMIFGFVENAKYESSGSNGWPRDIVLRFKDAAVKALSEILGVSVEEALGEVAYEAFGDRMVRGALGDEAKLRELVKKHPDFAAEYKASKEKDIVKFAEEFYRADFEKYKKMVDGKYRCDSYFYNGCLIECNCGFESYRAMVKSFGLDRYDTDEMLLEKARALLSGDVQILCEELNAGIIPMETGDTY